MPFALFLLELAVISRMIDSKCSAEKSGAVEIVDGEDGTSLIVVFEETKALGFSSFTVTD